MHRRQSRSERQRANASAVSIHQRVGREIKCIPTALERFKEGRDLFGAPDFEGSGFEANGTGRYLSLAL